MEDYRKLAQERYLKQKHIKIEEDEEASKIAELAAKEAEEKLIKLKEAQIKKQVYIQSQMLIIDEAIGYFETDKTDDNIMLILTIIKASIENIQDLISDDERKILIDQVIKFTNKVDAMNQKRPPGLNTIANVKILKEGFEQIYSLLKLDVDIQTLDTDDDLKIANNLQQELIAKADEEFARNLQQQINPHMPIRHDFIEPAIMPRPNPGVGIGVDDDILDRDDDILDRDDDMLDRDDDMLDRDDGPDAVNDEQIAQRLQDELNKPKKNKGSGSDPKPVLSSRYQNLSCDDFMKTLMGEKISR
jgi:hypothetical protein